MTGVEFSQEGSCILLLPSWCFVRQEGWRRGREGENRELLEDEEEYWERENDDLGLSEVGISPNDKEDKSQSSSIWVANSEGEGKVISSPRGSCCVGRGGGEWSSAGAGWHSEVTREHP